MNSNGSVNVTMTGANHLPEQPPGSLAGLEAVNQAALRLLDRVPRTPTTLRIQVGEVTLELGWAERPYPAAAASASAVDEEPAHGHDEDAARLPAADVAATRKADGRVAAEAATDYIHAPTVGTFYRAPEPGAKPFVEVGSVVAPGQQVGIVEVMKLMIPVESDRHCRITEVLVPDASPVEFGQRLFAVVGQEPA